MKILIAHNRYRIEGGDDRVAWETAKLFEEKGNKIIPFTMKDKNNWKSEFEKYFIDEIDYSKMNISLNNLRSSFKIIYSLESKNKIYKLIEDSKPDIAHLHNIYGKLTPSILHSLKKKKIPIVMTLHDYKLICPNYLLLSKDGIICEKCIYGSYYNCITTRCVKNSYMASCIYTLETYIHKILKIYENNVDYFIAPSKFMIDKMIEFGMPKDKFINIYNFVNISSYEPCYDSLEYCLYFGRLSREKGINLLIKTFKDIKSLQLNIAGTGPIKENLEKYVQENKMENVKFLGHLDKKSLSKVIQNSKFVILPSEWYENCPMSILESFAYGKPVIGAKIGGITELIDHDVDGLLFEPGDPQDLLDKIELMLRKDSSIIQMGKNARNKIEDKYNSKIYYQKLFDLYSSLISSN